MGKYNKRENCEYCEEKMDSKYRNKRFCSIRCRVYWNREETAKKKEIKLSNEQQELSYFEKLRNKRMGI